MSQETFIQDNKRVDWIWGTAPLLEYQELLGRNNSSLLDQKYLRRLNLTDEINEIFRNMRHGHRYSIKYAERHGVTIELFDSTNINREIWEHFLLAHKTTDSRRTRPARFWDITYECIEKGESILAAARYQEKWVAFGFIFSYQDRGYYGMGNVEQEYRHLSPSHLIQWTVIKYLKLKGKKFYDLGTDTPFLEEVGTTGDSEKEAKIIEFKRGFGGYISSLSGEPVEFDKS
ncbi:MAG: GNAT family N-acetyltransferase [Patescibacteria group bacterium]